MKTLRKFGLRNQDFHNLHPWVCPDHLNPWVIMQIHCVGPAGSNKDCLRLPWHHNRPYRASTTREVPSLSRLDSPSAWTKCSPTLRYRRVRCRFKDNFCPIVIRRVNSWAPSPKGQNSPLYAPYLGTFYFTAPPYLATWINLLNCATPFLVLNLAENAGNVANWCCIQHFYFLLFLTSMHILFCLLVSRHPVSTAE